MPWRHAILTSYSSRLQKTHAKQGKLPKMYYDGLDLTWKGYSLDSGPIGMRAKG